MTALYVALGIIAGALAAAVLVREYYKRRSGAAEGAAIRAGEVAAAEVAGRTAAEAREAGEAQARYERAGQDARNVTDPAEALTRFRTARRRLRRP